MSSSPIRQTSVKKVFFGVVVLAWLSLGQAMEAEPSSSQGPLPMIGLPPELSQGELENIEGEAIAGSGDAARRLAALYMVRGYHPDQAYYWYLIGAENGDAYCMYMVWGLRNSHKEKWSTQRGLYWLRKAAALGDEHAILQLKTIDSSH
jgi:TPR repeat protein